MAETPGASPSATLDLPPAVPAPTGQRQVVVAAPARLLRRGRPRRRHRGEGARRLRRPGLRPQADRAQPARRRGPRGPRGAIFVEELDEVPPGSTVVFTAHGVSPGGQGRGGRARPADHRRDLPAGHQGAPRGASASPARTARSCSSATPATRRSRARWARRPSAPPWSSRPADVDDLEVERPSQARLAQPDHAERRRDARDGRAAAEKFPLLLDPPSDDICYATTNRQAAVKQIAAHSDLVIVVGSANSSNSVRLVEVALEAGAKAVVPRRQRHRGRPRLARGRRPRSASPAAPRCPTTSSRACSSCWSSRATRPPARSG